MSNTTSLGGGGSPPGSFIPVIGTSTDRALATWNGTGGDMLYDNPLMLTTAAGAMKLTDGSSALPAYSFINAPDVGFALGFNRTTWSYGGIPWVYLDTNGTLGAQGGLTVTNAFEAKNNIIMSGTVETAVNYVVIANTNFVIYVTDTSAPRTVSVPNSTVHGTMFKIKDASFAAGTNNITLTTVGGTVLIDNATSQVININGGYMTIQYNANTTPAQYFII